MASEVNVQKTFFHLHVKFWSINPKDMKLFPIHSICLNLRKDANRKFYFVRKFSNLLERFKNASCPEASAQNFSLTWCHFLQKKSGIEEAFALCREKQLILTRPSRNL